VKILFYVFTILFLVNCGSSTSDKNIVVKTFTEKYPIHKNITVTVFWAGEPPSSENGHISNVYSAWNGEWENAYGGFDSPYDRAGYHPAGFTPKENPFYFALPYNDFEVNGTKKTDLSYIPWAIPDDDKKESICKNRWVKIIYKGKIAYAQWEDVGPFGEDDEAYVFGTAKPKNQINDNAGFDVSPAVRDYLDLTGINKVDWVFVDDEDVPDGPWKEIVTTSGINWVY